MTGKSHFYSQAAISVFFTIGGCAFFLCTSLSSHAQTRVVNGKTPLQIEVQDAQGSLVAGPGIHAISSTSTLAMLAVDREYQPGDRIRFSGPPRMAVQVDENIPECILYNPGITQEKLTYEIPYGRAEAETGSAYAPASFAGKSHQVMLRSLTKKEVMSYRNLALNPCDLLRSEESLGQIYPHASSNSVSRNLFDFEARNAIDGATLNGHHGVWPYQSWGPQLRTDIWWKVDFGRSVELDKVRLMVRADFPHDSYWKSADLEFSDGSRVAVRIESSADFQDFSFSKRKTSWLRLTNVVPEDPTKWCALIEIEAWGHDLP